MSLDAQDTLASSVPKQTHMPWHVVAWIALLIGVSFAPVITKLVHDWSTDDDMGHGFFVPVVAAYIVWQRRHELLAESYQPNWWGVVLIVWGTVQLLVATLGVELFLARTSLLISLTGVLMVMGGIKLVKHLLFPLALLVFMVPIPAIIYNQITFPLQLFASSVAETVLNLIGIPVFREGNILELPSQRLSVVEACSGIRSLLSLTFLSLVYGYFFDNKPWMRVALLIATVPIAIAANAGRVTITGILSETQPELAKGFFHSLEGWVIFMVALVILVITHQVINRVYGLLRPKP